MKYNFSIKSIFQALEYGNTFHDLSLILGILIMIYYLYRFIKYKMIEREDFLWFSVLLSSYFSIIGLCIINTYFDQSLWLVWLAEIAFFLRLYEKKVKVIEILLPTLILGLFLASITSFRHDERRKFVIVLQHDRKLVQYFKDAEKNNLEAVIITDPMLKKAFLTAEQGLGHAVFVSRWMYWNGYTSREIPLYFKDKNDKP